MPTPIDEHRVCVTCLQVKHALSSDFANSDFGRRSSEPDGIRKTCKVCENEASRRSTTKKKAAGKAAGNG